MSYRNIHIVILAALLTLGATGHALAGSGYRSSQSGVSHYLTFTPMGGEANTLIHTTPGVSEGAVQFHTGYDMKDKIGGDAQFEMGYEIVSRKVLFGLFGHVHYTYTRQAFASFDDMYRCKDINGDEMDYIFHYEDYNEKQHSLWAGGGLRLGYFFTPHFYAAVGAKVECPVITNYESNAQLSTTCVWHFAVGPVSPLPGTNNTDYGLFSADAFSAKGRYMATKKHLMVSPTVEIGTRIHIAGRAHLRVAAYMEYGLPIGAENKLDMIDYSKVRVVPYYGSNTVAPNRVAEAANAAAYWQNREELWSTLQLNSVLDFAGQNKVYNRLSVGVKLAFMFNLNGKPKCVTCDDDSGIAYTQPKHIRKKNDTRYLRW